jgi:hypothetical protein
LSAHSPVTGKLFAALCWDYARPYGEHLGPLTHVRGSLFHHFLKKVSLGPTKRDGLLTQEIPDAATDIDRSTSDRDPL